MNERIKELAEQATVRGEEYLPGNDGHPTPTVYFDKEMFAELLVRECAQVIKDCEKYGCHLPLEWEVMEHFGVEE